MIQKNELGERMIRMVFANVQMESLENRVTEFKEYRAFYEKDDDEIEEYIKTMLEDTYSKKSLETLRIQHRDIVQKVLNRKTSGIYDKEPKRKLVLSVGDDGKDEIFEELDDYLKLWNWTVKMKESLKRALWFNTTLPQAVWRNDKLEIDINTPDETEVDTNKFDYLKEEVVYLVRPNYETNEIWLAVWTKDDHYLLDANDNEVREIDGEVIQNNYNILPFSVLRIVEGRDYWGEPNSSLLQAQKELDADLTNMNIMEEYQGLGIWLGVNLPLSEGEILTPNKIINATNVKTDDVLPDLKCVVPAVQFDQLRENIDWNFTNVLMSEGLSATTSKTQVTVESGTAKSYDEIEIQEQRENLKWLMYKFEQAFFEVCRIVWNTENPNEKIPEGILEIEFSQDKPHSSVSDIVAKRNSDYQFKVSTPIDFVMEDKEVGKEEAVRILAVNNGLDEKATEEEVLAVYNKMNQQQQSTLMQRIQAKQTGNNQ
jgi:hypothetical protein